MSQTLFSREELEASKGAVGRIVRIVGPVVDVEFPADQIPSIYNALTVDAKTQAGDIHLVLEVETHLPGNLVRSVSMSSTDGLVRGLDVQDTGHPIMMPVGPKTLGRIFGTSSASPSTRSRFPTSSRASCPSIVLLPSTKS